MEKTWIVVAESARALIYEARNRVQPLREVAALEHPESRMKTRDLVTDEPGSTKDRAGFAHRSMDESDARLHEQELFAKEIAARLQKGRADSHYESLVVVAAPPFLGTLRRNLDSATGKLVTRSLDKNLVNKDEAEIREYLFG